MVNLPSASDLAALPVGGLHNLAGALSDRVMWATTAHLFQLASALVLAWLVIEFLGDLDDDYPDGFA